MTQPYTTLADQIAVSRGAIDAITLAPSRWRDALHGLLDAMGSDELDEGNAAHFGDLRNVFGSVELPHDGCERLYLKVMPFDLKINRTDEGLVVDIFDAHAEGRLESIASTYAYESETGGDEAQG